MKKIIITIAFCFSFAFAVEAQHVQLINEFGINADELADVEERIIEKVDDFQRWLQDLAGKGGASHDVKMEIYDRTLRLFIGKGQAYTVPVPDRYGNYFEQRQPAVTMECIQSKRTMKKWKQPMKEYLLHLIKNSENPNYRYSRVTIESADAVRVDNVTKLGDGRYTAVAHFAQRFAGYGKDGVKLNYSDVTYKHMQVFINRLDIPNPEGGYTTFWQILLGDVECDSIW